jgi:hypothetical protein
MSTASWTSVVTLTDVPSAELPAERLRSEGVSVEIRSDSAIMDQARYCDLIVPSNLLHRANCLETTTKRGLTARPPDLTLEGMGALVIVEKP